MNFQLFSQKMSNRIRYYSMLPLISYYTPLTKTQFPKRSAGFLRVIARLFSAIIDLRKSDLTHNIGTLYPKVNFFALHVYRSFLRYNPNNLGVWSTTNDKSGTRQLEYEVIHKLIDLYGGNHKLLEGYVSSGGTEGNIYSVWIAKSYLQTKIPLDNICLIKTTLTHYSIDKACSMTSIGMKDSPLNSVSWTIDIPSLEQLIRSQIKSGMRGFIISLTHGYTETGTSDDTELVSSMIEKIQADFKDIFFSIIIDAAFDGFVLPFSHSKYRPLNSKYVHAYSVDFSKFTAVPYPAGVVLCSKRLKELIEKEVPVFSIRDNTLLGSRPGASAAAIWAVIHRYGKTGFRNIINQQLKLKEKFILFIKETYPNSLIISSPYSLTCGVILHKGKMKRFSKEIENKYWIYAKNTVFEFERSKKIKTILYKFFFIPHVTKKSIHDFITDIHYFSSNGRQ